MLERYADTEITQIFSEKEKLAHWLDIELLVALRCYPGFSAGDAELVIESVGEVRNNLEAFLKEVSAREEITKHDVGAFVQVLAEKVTPGRARASIHYGLTSSDLVDTGLALAVKKARKRVTRLELDLLAVLNSADGCKVKGYTHGQRAANVPWVARLAAPLAALVNLPELPGKLSGPTNDHSVINEVDESSVLDHLGLKSSAGDTTQCTHRCYLADLIYTIARNGSCLAQFSNNMRLMVFKGELVRKPSVGEIGSSSMPHKVNPVVFEKVCGLARLLRGYQGASLEQLELWLERDMTHSSVDRIIIPDAYHVYCHMLKELTVAFKQHELHESAFPNENDMEAASYQRLAGLQASGTDRNTAWNNLRASTLQVQ